MTNGILYIIASPIGNMGDITVRALDVMSKVDMIFCEDTRHTRRLLQHYNISVRLESLHAHSSDSKIEFALKILSEGKNIAYMTDSGTPGISDPGSSLIRKIKQNSITIVPIPGPSALSTIISISGFPAKNIAFLGFLSKKEGKKRKELDSYKDFDGTIIIYESPYRIKKLLTAIYEIFPESEIVIGREMTKIYEEIISGKIKDIYDNIDKIKELGEFAIAVYTAR